MHHANDTKPQLPEAPAARKPYQPPTLESLGSIMELTKTTGNPGADGLVTGSQP
jgi:hypothetical protein